MNAKNQTPGEPLVAIVDDDVSMRGSVRRLLRCSGLQSEVFVSAEDFLQSGRVVKTACQVMDVRMPGMGGLVLLRHLVETRPTDPDLSSSALELARWRNVGRCERVPLSFCASPSAERRCCTQSVPCSEARTITNGKSYEQYR